MHRFSAIIFLACFSLSASAQEPLPPTSIATYPALLVSTENDFQDALTTFIEKAVANPLFVPSRNKANSFYFPILYSDGRYKIFGDGEPVYWMIPIGAEEKMTLSQAQLKDNVLEMWFHLKLPPKRVGYPFILEFHNMAKTTLRFVPERGDNSNSRTKPTIIPLDNGFGFGKEYNESGMLQIRVPLPDVAKATPPQNSLLREYLR